MLNKYMIFIGSFVCYTAFRKLKINWQSVYESVQCRSFYYEILSLIVINKIRNTPNLTVFTSYFSCTVIILRSTIFENEMWHSRTKFISHNALKLKRYHTDFINYY